MAHKETWSVGDLEKVTAFVADLENFLQATERERGIKVSDLMLTITNLEPIAGRIPWGLISFVNPDDTALQFEQGEFAVTVS